MGDINSDYVKTPLEVHTRTLQFISSVYQLEQLIKEPTQVTKSSATTIINDLSRVSWQNVECFDDPNLAWQAWKSDFNTILDHHAPIRHMCVRQSSVPVLHFLLLQMALCCHWIRARMFSLSYWTCRQHLIPLTIPCCWHDYRNHLVSVELYCNGSIPIFLIELSLLTSMRRIPGILRYEIFPWVFPNVQS